MVGVRYIVDSVEAALPFYVDQLGFKLEMHPAPGFALLSKGDLRLFLNQPGAGGAGASSSSGEAPEPRGWNRFQLIVEELDGVVAKLRRAGAKFRTDIVVGNGGRQALVEDPSGNLVELFEPKAR